MSRLRRRLKDCVLLCFKLVLRTLGLSFAVVTAVSAASAAPASRSLAQHELLTDGEGHYLLVDSRALQAQLKKGDTLFTTRASNNGSERTLARFDSNAAPGRQSNCSRPYGLPPTRPA